MILVGNSTNAFDLASSFSGDNMKISILTALFVMVILLFTFKSAGLPILLVLTIQGSIWINFSVPVLTGTDLFFLSYLVVSSIQMGATIDYAIVITNRYMELKTVMERKQAAVEALSQSFPTILTSGTIMAVAGFLIGGISTDATIGSVGQTLGRGTVTSIILVMTVLPQLLMLGDALIERTRHQKPSTWTASSASTRALCAWTATSAATYPVLWTANSRACSTAAWTPSSRANTRNWTPQKRRSIHHETNTAGSRPPDGTGAPLYVDPARRCGLGHGHHCHRPGFDRLFQAVYPGTPGPQGITVELTADLDLSGSDFTPVPIFQGTFHGNSHTISGFSFEKKGSKTGLFRTLTASAVWKTSL